MELLNLPLQLLFSLGWKARQCRNFSSILCDSFCAAGHLRLCSCVYTAGTLQASASRQEQGGEELSQTLHLEEVVPEAASEWQALAHVF